MTEPKLNTEYSVSGYKIIEILDCMMGDEGVTGVLLEITVKKEVCNIRAHYRLQRTLLACHSESKNEGEEPWSTEHGLTYRWLRRLIIMNIDFVMNQTHHELELLLQDTAESLSEGAPPVAYSGYEKFSCQFFSYASWNKSEFDDVCARQRDDY
jgi:hypothetical protein